MKPPRYWKTENLNVVSWVIFISESHFSEKRVNRYKFRQRWENTFQWFNFVIVAITTATQRAEIKNLASALAAQNEELERLKDDLMEMSRAPLNPQYFHFPGEFSPIKYLSQSIQFYHYLIE